MEEKMNFYSRQLHSGNLKECAFLVYNYPFLVFHGSLKK